MHLFPGILYLIGAMIGLSVAYFVLIYGGLCIMDKLGLIPKDWLNLP